MLLFFTHVGFPAPTNVRATALTPYSAEVKWDQSSGATGYLISYTTTANVTVSDGSTTSYTLTDLKQNTQYTITVLATSGDNRMSAKSNEVTVTTYADGKTNIMSCQIIAVHNYQNCISKSINSKY